MSKYLVYLTLSSVEDRKFVLYDFSQNIISSGWTLIFTFVQRILSCIGTYESSLLFDDNYHCFSKWVAEVLKHESFAELGVTLQGNGSRLATDLELLGRVGRLHHHSLLGKCRPLGSKGCLLAGKACCCGGR